MIRRNNTKYPKLWNNHHKRIRKDESRVVNGINYKTGDRVVFWLCLYELGWTKACGKLIRVGEGEYNTCVISVKNPRKFCGLSRVQTYFDNVIRKVK